MKAMLLAAGRGARMRPLTDALPKPLLEINGKPLIEYQLEALAVAGVEDIIINLGHLGKLIRDYLARGERFGVKLRYSDEGGQPLETAGGIIKALPFFDDEPFIVVNADIFSDFDYRMLPGKSDQDAHLVLVSNPPHNPDGDFALINGLVSNSGTQKLTYAGIGLFHPRFFKACHHGKAPLAPLLRRAAAAAAVGGQHYRGVWHDVGTPERLLELNQ